MEGPQAIPLGKRNATFQVLQSLRLNRANRSREKRFIVEGVKPLQQLARAQWPLESLLLREGKISPWAQAYAKAARPETRYLVAPELMAELSNKDEDPELIAVAKVPGLSPSALPIAPDGVYVIADRPNSPGNLGSLIRTAEAFGAQAVLTYGHAADFFDPKTITASIGAVFALPLAHIEGSEGFRLWKQSLQASAEVQVVALDEQGSVNCGDLKRQGTMIVVVGNETDGLSKNFKEQCDVKVRIPMVGTATSLNMAASGSILLYELLAR